MSIASTSRERLPDGRDAFVKRRPGAPADEFETEAACLRWLAEPGVLRVPAVLDVGPEHLAIEYVAPGTLSAAGEEELGRGLAQLHAAGADGFGAPWSLRFGRLVLPNDPAADFAGFYAERRLAPLARHAPSVTRVIDRIHELAGPPEPPARIHGDLWSGNVHAGADGRPWLIDPAAYGGHREVDLAMLELFGGRRPRVWAAYDEAAPLADGWRERVALWQLFPLLVHAELFGGHYPQAAERAAASLV